MTDYWDNVEILREIDLWQRETYGGGPLHGVNGLCLLQRMTGSYAVDRMRGFIQELHISADRRLLTFRCNQTRTGRIWPTPTRTRTCRRSAISR